MSASCPLAPVESPCRDGIASLSLDNNTVHIQAFYVYALWVKLRLELAAAHVEITICMLQAQVAACQASAGQGVAMCATQLYIGKQFAAYV